jgi:hypothetical protein
MPENPVILILQSTAEDYFFADVDMPIMSRRIDNARALDQGHSRVKYTVTFSGFFTGNTHDEIIEKYMALEKSLKVNDLQVYYYDGQRELMNYVTCYLDSLNEPGDWKQYDGTYAITLHYFGDVTDSTSLGIQALYTSSVGTYSFLPPPNWSSTKKPVRKNPYRSRVSGYGNRISDDVVVTLSGFVARDSHSELKAEAELMDSIFAEDGQLDYGEWSDTVRIVSRNIPTVFPVNYFNYSIQIAYKTEDIHSISSKRIYGMVHKNPKIKERFYCDDIDVKEYGSSGQEVQYDASVSSKTIELARELLAQEVMLLVHPDGVLLKGGTETQDDDALKVSVSFKRYYKTPPLANIYTEI